MERTYVHYVGQVVQPTWWGDKTYNAIGRLMVDPMTCKQVDQDTYNDVLGRSGLNHTGRRDDNSEGEFRSAAQKRDVPAEDLWRIFPFTVGFSFIAKTWGRVDLAEVSDIKWRDDSFSKLVMDEDEKELIRSLVENYQVGFADLIDNKSGGCIFMLHGAPGTGKTLTAETIAEMLHRPLYSMTVGELGVTPKELEESLRVILDVAKTWDAVILLDEADIYLEARDEHDLVRNAMVGVFLRLLEYHQGVMFLTSNRVRNIDRAFYSRISLSIQYNQDDIKRTKIWHNLLEAANIEGITDQEIERLGHVAINGRQIKTALRLSQVVAHSKNTKVNIEIINGVITNLIAFELKFESKEENNKDIRVAAA